MNFEVDIFFLDDSNVTSRAFRIYADRVCCGCGGRYEASVSRLYGMLGVNVWFDQVKSRVGPEMKQDLLLSCWNWRPGVAVNLLASSLVDVYCMNLAAVDVDAEGGGCCWRHGGGRQPENGAGYRLTRGQFSQLSLIPSCPSLLPPSF
ncbi:hypothetical protein Taro_056705 [Colocasia esculenta]|uniref:Uncharacterized protein n=1 Tax=Colocasia esculenta TaxID=4460 RepID=A0A843XU64_COLES|nr:hypothetical protein [Colocasia esculenta]